MLLRKKKTSYSLIPLMGLFITGAIFVLLTSVRNQRPLSSFDKKWSHSLFKSHTFSTPLMELFTRLGSGFFMIPLGLMMYVSYNQTGNRDKGKLILFNVIGIRVLNFLCKRMFKRQPPEWERLVESSNYGYPSAHTMNAAGFYGLLLFLSGMWRHLWAWVGCFLFLVMIGISRVKLGIHYLIDVIAGLAGGMFLNLLSIKSYKWFFGR
ncbi:phosphatase PAP2 family protein [Fictibacillus nanhaiensis]|uniref:phosphatase PAP2 family protein n=1 Tax=Fictibacillus nanhaiensis TaxID=742169 RepID=UPI001C972DBF|nr:phosphatase PAP2 family protein [Fictibacillus nanhaiensis]MBY6037796.1 phosphatase PAP2 family protein [Fictibacillus nanhaiensis]